ncbi:MAG: hypothetical protein ABJG15_12165 [Hyphomonadaceae bacterium]
MSFLKIASLSLAAVLLCMGTTTACAEQQTTQETAANADTASLEASLDQAIADYDKAIELGDTGNFVMFGMSPKVLAHLAAEAGEPEGSDNHAAFVDSMRAEMISTFEGVLNAVTKFEYQYDRDNLSFETTDTDLTYTRLPTVANIVLPNQAIRSTGETIAVLDAGNWYFLNPQDAETIGWIKAAYPELQDLQIEPNKTEIVPQ